MSAFRTKSSFCKGPWPNCRPRASRKILVLSHVGYNRDQEIVAAVDGISAIIGGHSHTRMSNTEEGAVEYATLVASPSGRAVPIVQAFAFSRYLGELQLDFAEDGAVVSASGDTVLLDASFAPAEDIEALIAPLAAPIERLVRAPVAEIAAPIDGERENCRARECEMGNTVADAMLAEVADRGIKHRAGQWWRSARLHRCGHRDLGRCADGAAVPEHALHAGTAGCGACRGAGTWRE